MECKDISKHIAMYNTMEVRINPVKVSFFGKPTWKDAKEVRRHINTCYKAKLREMNEAPQNFCEKIVKAALMQYEIALLRVIWDRHSLYLKIVIDYRRDFENFSVSVYQVRSNEYPMFENKTCLTSEFRNESFYEERQKFKEECRKYSEDILWQYFKNKPKSFVDVTLYYNGLEQKSAFTEDKFNEFLERLGDSVYEVPTGNTSRRWCNGSSFSIEAAYKTDFSQEDT